MSNREYFSAHFNNLSTKGKVMLIIYGGKYDKTVDKTIFHLFVLLLPNGMNQSYKTYSFFSVILNL